MSVIGTIGSVLGTVGFCILIAALARAVLDD